MAPSAVTKNHKISIKLKEIRSEKNNFYDFDRKIFKRPLGRGDWTNSTALWNDFVSLWKYGTENSKPAICFNFLSLLECNTPRT